MLTPFNIKKFNFKFRLCFFWQHLGVCLIVSIISHFIKDKVDDLFILFFNHSLKTFCLHFIDYNYIFSLLKVNINYFNINHFITNDLNAR